MRRRGCLLAAGAMLALGAGPASATTEIQLWHAMSGANTQRIEAIVASRVPDLRLVLDHMQPVTAGLVGHSLGGWSVLAAADADPRVTAVVALAPGGSRHPPPGVLRLPLRFTRSPGVPTLVLAGENDVPVPLDDVLDVFHRAPQPKRLVVLRRADHQHFVDDVAGDHEALRAMDLPEPATWMSSSPAWPKAISRPVGWKVPCSTPLMVTPMSPSLALMPIVKSTIPVVLRGRASRFIRSV